VKRVCRFVVAHYLVVPLGVGMALIWASTDATRYFQFAEALSFAVNDIGLAFAIAFLAQEVVEATLPGGALHPWRRAALPLVAAAGGTLGAIAVYLAFIYSRDESVLAQGWPIASAVDTVVCYAVARSIFRRAAGVSFLLLLTIASNVIGLVLVSQRYPVAELHPAAAALIVPAIGGAAALRRSHVRNVWPYVLLCGSLSWFGCYWSGIHPALALLPIVPFLPHAARGLSPAIDRPRGPHESGRHFEYVFKYPVQVIAFLFGLVNGGVLIRGYGSGTWAMLSAALVGRPFGVLLALGVGVAAGLQLPHRFGWRDAVVIALAASPSFAFGLFFATAVFPVGPLLIQTEMGALATIVGWPLALASARLFRVGRFALHGDDAPPRGAVENTTANVKGVDRRDSSTALKAGFKEQ
jgi:Na+:H+ antiporter, NhaA family